MDPRDSTSAIVVVKPTHARRRQRWFWSVAVILFAISCFLHFWRLGVAPLGMFGDECSIAYNAYCIAQTGADEYGTPHPVFFRCFDNYQDPVMVYCIAPLTRVFGLEQWVARFPSALFQVLAGLAFAGLAWEHCRNKWLSLAAGFCFSILPWTFPVSRTVSSGYTAMLFGMSLGWWLLLVAFRKRSMGRAILAGLAWAFGMYAHNIGRPMTALLLVCFVAVMNRLLLRRWRVGVVFSVSLLVALLPMIVSVINAPRSLSTRFQSIGIFKDHPSTATAIGRFVSRYVEYFDPRFLFWRGDQNLRHHTGIGGELFWFLAPLVLLGIYCLIRFAKRQTYYRFLGIGLLVYPTAAALTIDHTHSTRSINGAIFWLMLAVIGARWLWLKRGHWRSALLVLLGVWILQGGWYFRDYFSRYQQRSAGRYQEPLTRALTFCFSRLGADQVLYVSGSVYMPYGSQFNPSFKPFLYVHLLFYGKIDPHIYQREGVPREHVIPYDVPVSKPGLLLRCDYVFPHGSDHAVYVPDQEPRLPLAARLVKTFNINGQCQYEILEVR